MRKGVERGAGSPLPTQPDALERMLAAREAAQATLKPDNEARILWAGARYAPTPVAFVYLHGHTASQGEGEPTHRRLAARFGANLYLNRLPGHGLSDPEAMAGLDAQQLLDAAAEALAIGRVLGQRVVLIGTSMGAALALALAAAQPDAVAAIVAWSPGIRPRQPEALAAAVQPGPVLAYDPATRSAVQQRYWSLTMHRDSYRALKTLFDLHMVEATFARVVAPLFMACYYRDAANQDPSASVEAMQWMYDHLGTPPERKRVVLYADAAHAIACAERSPAAGAVLEDTTAFLRDVVGLPLVSPGA